MYSYPQKKSNKKLIALVTSALFALGGIISFPYLKTAYQKHSANTLIESTSQDLETLKKTYSNAVNIIENNKFLMTGPEEIAPLYAELEDTLKKTVQIKETLQETKNEFQSKDYDIVRETLDPKFGLKSKTRITPSIIAKEEKGDLDTKVIRICQEKREARDTTVNNEWYLKARLKKPLTPDNMEEVKVIPKKFIDMIPIANPDLELKLSQLLPELNNSLGANIIRINPLFSHIAEFGKTPKISANARSMYDAAFSAYMKVREKNDALTWYRAEQHDGKFLTSDYKELLQKQNEPISFIHLGDENIRALDNYFKELHEQYFIFVSSHDKKSKTFSHWETESYTTIETDSNGNTHEVTGTTIRHYTTNGYQFFYILATVAPEGTVYKNVYVGEKDSHNELLGGLFGLSWNYRQDEQVNWVREWKRLHYDNTDINNHQGWMHQINPHIENDSACRNLR